MSSLAHFKDRQEAINAFNRLWDAPQPWILAFTGFSGQGKTTLLEYLEIKRCQEQNIPYARIGLSGFSTQIRDAFHHLLEVNTSSLRTHLPAKNLKRYQKERRAALEDRNRRHLALTQHQEMRGSAAGEQSMSANLAEAYKEMERQVDDLIFDAWLDCMEALKSTERVVFLLDDYDLFQNQTDVEDLERFWGLLERARGRLPGLRITLASREKLRHTDRIYPLQNGMQSDDLQPLAPEDSDALLRSMHVNDAAYRQAVYQRLAQGHPLVTRMAAEAWLEADGGIAAAEVPRLSGLDAAVEWVQGRILERLDQPLKQAARWAALLRWFDAETLNAVLPTPLSEGDFPALRQRAFVGPSRVREEKWACHDLVRRVQSGYLQRERPQAWRDFHQRAQQYFQAQNEPLEALYHHFFSTPAQAFEQWSKKESSAAFEFNHETWAALIEIGLAPELPLEDRDWAKVRYRAGRRHYYRAEWDAALERYAQALERFNAIGDRLGQANVSLSLGELYFLQEDAQAQQRGAAHLDRALALYREIGERVGQTNVHSFRARVLAHRGRPTAALESARQALDLALSFAPEHSATQNLAAFVQDLENQIEAENR